MSASQKLTLPVPGPDLQLCGVEVAVDEDAGSGVRLSEGGGWCEWSVSCGLRGALSSVRGSGAGFLDGLLVADESADVVEGGGVGDAGKYDFGTVVVDDGLGEGAVAGLDLGEVLPDGDELDADAARGGGDLREIWKRCDVGCFVDDELQRLGEPIGRAVGPVVDAGDGLFDERGEERSEPGLLVQRPAYMQGVAAAVEESIRVNHRVSDGGGEHTGVGEGSEDGLGRGVGGGSGAFFSVDGGSERLEGVELAGLVEGAEGFFFVFEVDPTRG